MTDQVAIWSSAVAQSSFEAAQKKVEKGVAVEPGSRCLLTISVVFSPLTLMDSGAGPSPDKRRLSQPSASVREPAVRPAPLWTPSGSAPVGNPSGDRLLQTIRRLPEHIPVSVSLRDCLRDVS